MFGPEYRVCAFVFVVKYLGLLAMSKILKTHPKSVQSHKDLILQCLDDKDESIRLRALDLLYGMVQRHNCPGLSRHLVSGSYSMEAVWHTCNLQNQV